MILFLEELHKKGKLNIPIESEAQKIDESTNLILKSTQVIQDMRSQTILPGHHLDIIECIGVVLVGGVLVMGSTSSPWGKRFSRPRTISWL